MRSWIRLLTSIVIVGAGTDGVYAQDVATLERNIQLAEQTLKNEPYLTQYCGLLKSGDYFFHRGRYRAGKPPVVALAAWETALRRATVARRLGQDQADKLLQEAKRRRSEVQNACNLDYWKQELARIGKPKIGSSAEAGFVWNREPDANRVLNGRGTLTGSLSSWRFTGQAVPSWNSMLRINVTCTGQLDPGVKAEAGAKGTMTCHAEWVEGGKRQVWDCRGPGTSRAVWSIGDHWFGIWPAQCVGTVTADNKTYNNAFGLVSLKSKLGLE